MKWDVAASTQVSLPPVPHPLTKTEVAEVPSSVGWSGPSRRAATNA